MCYQPQPPIPQKSDEEKLAELARAAEPISAQWASARKLSAKLNARIALRATPYIFAAVVVGLLCLTGIICFMIYRDQSKEIPATMAAVAGVIGIFFAGRASKK